MAEISQQNPVDTEPATTTDMGDQSMDLAYRDRENNATAKAANKVTGNTGTLSRNEAAESSAGYDNIPQTENGIGSGPSGIANAEGMVEVLCGPLLNYKHMNNSGSGGPTWHGSVLIVTTPSGQISPKLQLKYAGRVAHDGTMNADVASTGGPALGHGESVQISGLKLYEDPYKAFWRFSLELPFQDHEATWEYNIPDVIFSSDKRARTNSSKIFVIPAATESMRIMFHSCNGFSVGTDEDAWSGPALWGDVLRIHNQKPFHVMIGGGDQIYNDGIRVGGPLKPWTDIGNPRKRRDYPFPRILRDECDKFYFNNYVRWFSTEPFASANGIIPQVNIWDDHDIIDGFGSYTDHFMRCAVFRGIGSVSLKYYLLFQHHIPPPASTYTTDAPQIAHKSGPAGQNRPGADPEQLKDCFVLQEKHEDSSFIISSQPGPYVEERSRSLWMQFGARIGFIGIDARTERTRHQVNYPDTYDLIFKRAEVELSANPALTHLIVLLGVPIAYPRLQWLENVFTSPVIAPIRFLNKRFGLAGGFFNHFDGQVDLLDDLDDHYTARHHKKERKALMLRLQILAEAHNVRVSILGGDVHLAAIGRFYSNPKLSIPPEQDHRYMANIISSAITNKPPPKAVANLLARRNFIHHLNESTDETLMNLFDKDPGSVQLTKQFNKCTMPSRNYAIITENHPSSMSAANGSANGHIGGVTSAAAAQYAKDGHSPLHSGEEGAGTKHPVASGVARGTLVGGLDVAIRVEIDQHDREGNTQGYGFSIPSLKLDQKQSAI